MAKQSDPRKIRREIERKTEILGGIYSRAYKEIIEIVEKDAGTLFRRERAKRMLANLNGVLAQLDADTRAFIEKEIPNLYKSVAAAAKYDLVVDGKVIEQAFSQIHVDAIKIIADEAKTRFAESMQAVKKSALEKISLAQTTHIREAIGAGATLGKARETVARTVLEKLEQDGIVGLLDKSGKNWQLDRYARMLTGEVLASTGRQAIANVGTENGFDVYQITRHGAKDACRFHEGELFSMTGATPGMPTFAELRASGEIFHVGCRHSYFVMTNYSKKQEKASAKVAERLQTGGKISNYDALKNKEASAADALAAQEARRKIGDS